MILDTENFVEAQDLIARYSRIRARDHDPTLARCSCLRRHVHHERRGLMVLGEVSANSELSVDGRAPICGWKETLTCCALASRARVWSSSC